MRRIPLTYCPACGAKAFQVVNAKQFRCASCGFVYFQNVAAAAGAVIESVGQVLLVRRAKDPDRGLLDLPGGFVDPGESLEQALVRELKEELGLALTVEHCSKYFCSSVNEYFYKGVLYHSLDMFFKIQLDSQPEITPADDVGDYLWLTPEDIKLSEIAFSSVRDALQCYRVSIRG
ncbi:MAG: NUDIX domain-containing protein [Cyanobacteria bacterium J06632_22]